MTKRAVAVYKGWVVLFILLLSPKESALDTLFRMPSRLEIPAYTKARRTQVETPDLYPIGWSRDGKLAFILADAWSDGCGCQRITLGIYDLATDGYAWSRDSVYFGDPSPKHARQAWRDRRNQFAGKLREAQIIPLRLELRAFPCFLGQDTIRVGLDLSTIEPEDTEWMLPFVKQARVLLYSIKRGEKVVYQTARRDSGHLGLLDVSVLGYLQSPLENRIAVLLSQTTMGWEGPPHTAYLRIIGCDLEKGFKKR